MTAALTSGTMSPEILKVVERARTQPNAKFHALAYLIDVEALRRAYQRARKGASVGVDGVSKEQFGQDLERNLQDLHERLKTNRYRHQPIRRVHIPKGDGKMRPLGISTFEDKLVQDALREVLEAVYEQDFLPCSYGFRRGRRAHDAIKSLMEIANRGEANWVLEADVTAYFDSVDRSALMEFLRIRIADGSLLRLIGKCLNVGVLDGEQYLAPETGTTQGSALSPLLGNVYMHYILDTWFEQEVRPRMRGKAQIIRYADDFIMCFEREEDARRVMLVLGKRLGRFGLTLHPDKTRLVPFLRPPRSQQGGQGPGTFDLLVFTIFWRRTLRGRWMMGAKTRSARLRRSIMAVYDWCRHHRHLPIKEQHAALVRRIRGHYNYFGVNGNMRCLGHLEHMATKAWYKWLRRRSQRKHLTWERFAEILTVYPLPRPHVAVQIW